MPQVQAKRRLVKSPPELWSELSDAAALARHLGEFGEIRITRLDPESKVVWEGDRASGSVELESAGWGTQVTFTVEVEEAEAEPEVAEPTAADGREPEPLAVSEKPQPEPEPVAVREESESAEASPAPALPPPSAAQTPPPRPAPRRGGFLSRLFGREDRVETVIEAARETVAVEPAPEPEPAPKPEPAPEPEPDQTVQLLENVLDQLGSAHHRPFSRA